MQICALKVLRDILFSHPEQFRWFRYKASCSKNGARSRLWQLLWNYNCTYVKSKLHDYHGRYNTV